MTREEIVESLRWHCRNVNKPCAECSLYKKCYDNGVNLIEKMSNEKLAECYKIAFGYDVEVEGKMVKKNMVEFLAKYCGESSCDEEHCKCYGKCTKDMVFAARSEKELKELIDLILGTDMETEPVKTLMKVEKMTYPRGIRNIVPAKDFVKMITDKGYYVEVEKSDRVVGNLWLTVYKEVEMKE